MKIRTNFVSNSSSSSFIAITYDNVEDIKGILLQKGIDPEDNYWYEELKESRYGMFDLNSNFDLMCLEDCYIEDSKIALCIENLLNKDNKTVDECKQLFIHKMKKDFGIDVSMKDIDFEYGEWGNE